METKYKVIFRVDSNKDVGLGHMKRCLALAKKFQENGHAISFAGAIENFFAEQVIDESLKCHIIKDKSGSEGELLDFLSFCKRAHAQIVVLDTYDLTNQYCQRIIDEGYFVVSIHDTGMEVQASHMIINPAFRAEKIQYDVSEDINLLLGIENALLPKEYWNVERKEQCSEKIENVLVTMGGVDGYDLTTRILQILDERKENFAITVIVGPYFENRKSIADQIERMGRGVRLVDSPPSLFPYIRDCSVVVSGAGQTLYQCAVFGRPTIGIILEENQVGHLQELSKIEAIISLAYEQGSAFNQRLKDHIAQLMEDSVLRTRLSQTSAKLIDGQGSQRVYEKIVSVYQEGEVSYA